MPILKPAFIFTVLIEAVTLFSRFVLTLESTRDTDALKHLTFGLRLHHGYFGVLLILLLLIKKDMFGRFSNIVFSFAIALVASDLIHHFLVLWPITGDHQFDLAYPK